MVLYPFVGLLIGLVLYLLGNLLPVSLLGATLLEFFWVLITGGLHLDGLADSSDAWLGGLADRERTLKILKDPRCGSAAVWMLVLVLMLKVTAVDGLLQTGQLWPVILAPLLARTAAMLLLQYTPYVRADGIASDFVELIPAGSVKFVTLLVFTGCLLAGLQGILIIVLCVLLVLSLRQLSCQRIGGITGDVCGAVIELCETLVLIAALL